MPSLVRALVVTALALCAVAQGQQDELDESLLNVTPTYSLTETAAALDFDAVLRDARFLSSLSSRMPGTAGSLIARDYLLKRMEEAGLERIGTEAFKVLAPVPTLQRLPASLTLDGGAAVRLEPVWPNLVRPSRAPRGGLSGPLVYVGNGDLEDFDRENIEGCIALMEFASGRAWYTAAMVGAKAVVFLGDNPSPLRGEAEEKFSEQPLSTPRFLAVGQAADALRDATRDGASPRAVLRGGARWREVTGKNLYGFIPGTDPELASQPVILTTWYDSVSVAPTVAPGAEGAANCGFVLELARLLREHPPARPVIVLFTDAHGISMAGMRSFVKARVTHWRAEKPKPENERKLEDLHFRGLMAFDLSSHGTGVGAFYKGFYYNYYDAARFKFSDFGTACRDYGWLIARDLGLKRERSLIDCINTGVSRSWGTYLPGGPCLEAECATLAGYAGTSFATAGDLRQLVDTYADTYDRLDHANLERQMRVLAAAVPNLLCERLPDSDVGMFGGDPDDGFATVKGGVYEFGRTISFLPEDPMPGAIALWGRITKTRCGVRRHIMSTAQADGSFELAGLPMKTHNWDARTEIAAFVVDPETGEVTYAPDRGAQGSKRLTFDDFLIEALDTKKDIVLFRANQVSVIDTIDPGHFGILSDVRVLDQKSKAAPYKWGMVKPSWMDPRLPGDPEPAVVVYGQPDTRLILLLKPGFEAPRILLLNATEAEPLGEGIDVNAERVISSLAFRGASDVWWLDDARMKRFERFGVGDPKARQRHDLARKALDEAAAALEAGRTSEYVSLSRRALALENRVYPRVEGTARDVVYGVIFYLVLLLPFSFLTERLLLAGRTIGKQAAGAIGIFLLVFLILAFVHPAFRVTTTPLIVLLAFILMVLGVLVGAVIFRHFDQQMEEYRYQTTGLHDADMARLSSAAAAFSLGVGNMRRRATRTSLTCFTLVLLTFTVMSFTSVNTEQRVRKLKTDTVPLYDGALIRQPNYGPFSEYAYTVLEAEIGGAHPMSPRSWTLSEGGALRSEVPIRLGDADYAAGALLGLGPDEPKVSGVPDTLMGERSRWFTDDPEDLMTCILPTRIAESLGVDEDEVGDATVEIRGVALKVIGIYDGDAVDDLWDLDGEMMTPIDEVEQGNLRRSGKLGPDTVTTGDTATTTKSTPHISANEVVILPHRLNIRLGGALRNIAVATGSGDEARAAQERLVERLDLGVFAGADGRTEYRNAIDTKQFSGLQGSIVPIMIAALIVLNTMLGSVFERVKEIGTYSSLGLSPAHVGFLFLAEAAVYAVLGAILGYLIGQSVAWFSVNFNWLSGLLELNYSSLAAVGTTIIVMSVVFLSTLYPARKAADLAVAGVERRWRLPDPEGDVLTVEMPFTMQDEETLGLMAYVAEYLDAHADYSVGEFATDGATLHRLGPGESDGALYVLRFNAWLSPYDLGVSEEVELRVVPTEEDRVLGALARIYRVSGDVGAWVRCTRMFLHLLRKQFLLWRTFPPAEKTKYHESGQEVVMDGESRAAG